jgi:hypothetical protein
MFVVAAAAVQAEPSLEHPNSRGCPRDRPDALPPAILFVGGHYADPFKVYVPQVNWAQPLAQDMRIQEIDLVGATKWLAPIRRRAPDGTRLLLGSKLVAGNAIDRYALAHPITTGINGRVELTRHRFRRELGGFVGVLPAAAG